MHPKGRSTLYNGVQKFPPSNQEGHQTSWNLIPNLKFQIWTALGCYPSQAGLHGLQGDTQRRQPGCGIHLSHRQDTGSPCLQQMVLSISRAASFHQDTNDTWLENTSLSRDAVGPTKKTVAENKLADARATLPATSPLPHIWRAPGKSKAGSWPSTGKTALAGLWDRSGHWLDASSLV